MRRDLGIHMSNEVDQLAKNFQHIDLVGAQPCLVGDDAAQSLNAFLHIATHGEIDTLSNHLV